MAEYVMAIDQGTTSTRAMLFTRAGEPAGIAQREHEQIFPRAGWVEHDAVEIWTHTQWVISEVLRSAGLGADDVAAIGITNQRETTIVWNRHTGEPISHAIVWQDTRTQPLIDELAAAGGIRRFAAATGLPLATYFSASKIAWMLEHVPGARAAAQAGDLLFGTPDTWVLWNLTRDASAGRGDAGAGPVHATDVTNASRTLLMDLRTLEWSSELLETFGIPRSMMPEIRSSSEVLGTVVSPAGARGVPIAGILGDQQAATFGQAAFRSGESKNTYGTGNFVIVNTGTEIVESQHGLISTVAYRLGDGAAHYALEGSIAVTGSLVQWLRDNLGMFSSSDDIERLAASVDDNGGAYFVPAFSGLFAPYWRSDARGALVGLTRFVNRGHIARAALEATAFQTHAVLGAVQADTGVPLRELRVDGGMTQNNLLMQFQADLLGVPVVRPKIIETTALGAAYAAGLAVGHWSLEQLREHWAEERRWVPQMAEAERSRLVRMWEKAVTKSLDWVDDDVS